MKRRCLSLIIVICLVSVVVVGCVGNSAPDTSPGYKFGTDCQYNHYSVSINGFLTESEKGFYYTADGYLHFVDKHTMQDTILCGKPNCLHGKEFSDSNQVHHNFECNAYVHGLSYFVAYDGALYCVIDKQTEGFSPSVEPVFTRISEDGSSRKELFPVDFGVEEGLEMPSYHFFIHRGVVYFATGFAKRDKETYWPEVVEYRIYSYNLTTKKTEKLYSIAADAEEGYWGNNIYAIGDNIYLISGKYDGDDDDHIWRFNLSTKEVTFFEYGQRVLPVGDKLLYYFVDFDLNGEERSFRHWLEVSDLDGSNRQAYTKIDLNDHPMWIKQIQTDGEHLFITDNYGEPGATEIRTYDFQTGEQIATIPMPEKVAPMGDRQIFCSQDGKLWTYSVLGYDENGVLPRIFFYCDISTIGTPDFQWQEVEKVN